MVEELVFHLGDCKTGTTSVQSILAAEAWESAGKSICYTARFNHIPLAKTLTQDTENQKQRFVKTRQQLAKSDAKLGVISAEHFEFVDPEVLYDALKKYMPKMLENLRLVAYIRPHADRLVSSFAERSKKGLFMRSLEAMHDKADEGGLLHYAPRLRKWREVFGDRYEVRPFVRSELLNGDVVQDFFSFALRTTDFKITQPTQANESLSVEDISMMRLLHQTFRDDETKSLVDQRKAFGWFMSEHLGNIPSAGGTKLRMHKALAEKVAETYREDAEILDREFFGRPVFGPALDAAPGKAIDEPQSLNPKDNFSPEEIRRYEAFASILQHLMASDPKHFNWALRPEEQRRPLEVFLKNRKD